MSEKNFLNTRLGILEERLERQIQWSSKLCALTVSSLSVFLLKITILNLYLLAQKSSQLFLYQIGHIRTINSSKNLLLGIKSQHINTHSKMEAIEALSTTVGNSMLPVTPLFRVVAYFDSRATSERFVVTNCGYLKTSLSFLK